MCLKPAIWCGGQARDGAQRCTLHRMHSLQSGARAVRRAEHATHCLPASQLHACRRMGELWSADSESGKQGPVCRAAPLVHLQVIAGRRRQLPQEVQGSALFHCPHSCLHRRQSEGLEGALQR